MYLNADIFYPQKSLFNSGVRLELEDVLHLKCYGIYLNSLVAVIQSPVRIPDFMEAFQVHEELSNSHPCVLLCESLWVSGNDITSYLNELLQLLVKRFMLFIL